jgi:hypothetical protein
MNHFKDGRIVNKDQGRVLFITCNLTLITAIYAFYKRIYLIPTLCILFIWITSILYWHHPINNWRRYLDIYGTHLSIAIYILCLFLYKPLYWFETIIAVVVFGMSLRNASFYYSDKYWETRRSNPDVNDDGNNRDNPFLWISTLFHSLLHITINTIGLFSIHNYHLMIMP